MKRAGRRVHKRLLIVVLVAAMVAAIGLLIGSRHGLGTSSPPQCNVLLITLDTTRADHLGCYGYSPALTPALDRLAAAGVAFDHAFSNVPMTLPSHATVMTGLLPPEHGVRVNGEQRIDLPKTTLAEILRDQGYQTGAFIAAVVLDHANGLDRGFDIYQDEVADQYKRAADVPASAYRPGDTVADGALAWLRSRNRQRPFFCWVHFFDPHFPYFAHQALAGTRYAGQANYDGEIAFMDIQVARLMAYLEKEKLTQNTLVIAFGDHGEGLGDHGEGAHGHMLYDSTLRVPLIFSLPGRIKQGLRVPTVVSLVDLFATIQDVAGTGRVEERSGRSLASALMGREIPAVPSYGETMLPFASFNWSPQWSLVTPDWKYIRSARPHLYDRAADPGEMANLAPAQPSRVEELEEQLKGLESEMVTHSAGQVELPKEAIDRLAALGYLAGGHQNYDSQKVDYASLRDMDDMSPILREVPVLRAMGAAEPPPEELVTELRRILAITPESFSFRASLVFALVKMGRAQEALVEALEYIKLKPDDHDMCQTIATTYLYLGRPVEAVPYFWEALNLKADFAPAHEELAKLLRNNGVPEAADRHTPEHSYKLGKTAEQYELGIVLAGHQRFDEAFRQFDEALRIAPDDPLIYSAYAFALELKGDYAAAAQRCAEAVRLDPDDPERLNQLGKILGEAGKYVEAAECLAKFVQSRPQDVPARTNLGLVLARQGRLDEAMDQLSEALRLAPGDGQVHLIMGGVLEENGRLAEAVAEYREAVRLNPNAPDWANHLARILATNGDARLRDGAEAVKLAERACAATGEKDAGFLDTLAAAYAEVGRFDDAVVAARKALAVARDAQKADLATEIQQRLSLYEKARPYHAAAEPLTQ